MKNILKITIIFAFVLLLINGCVKEDFDNTPEYVTDWVANTTIKDLKDMYTTFPITIDTDLIIKGIVVSNDEYGNFYKELFIQDETGAIGIELDDGYLYSKYPVGRLVYVNCNGLTIGRDYGIPKLGLGDNIDRIYNVSIEDYLDISVGGQPIDPQVIDLNDVSTGSMDSLIGCFIKFENVEFQDFSQTFATVGDYYSEREIVNCDGKSITLSTSEYVSFISDSLPKGNGSISAVLGKFSGQYQLRLNSPDDIDFSGARCTK